MSISVRAACESPALQAAYLRPLLPFSPCTAGFRGGQA